jgi:hypothetical protein
LNIADKGMFEHLTIKPLHIIEQTIINTTNEKDIIVHDSHGIVDENGNAQLIFNTTEDAVSYLSLTNAASGSGVALSAESDTETDVDIDLVPKGNGSVNLGGNLDMNTYSIQTVTPTEMAYLHGVEAALNILAPQYQTIYIDAGAMIPCTTNGAESGTYEYPTNDIDMDYMAMDAGATKERKQFKTVLPENWDRGTVKAKVYWTSATGSTAGDTVEFAVKAGARNDGDPIDVALGTAQIISDVLLADNGGAMQITGATPAITIAGTPGLNALIIFEVYRNTDGTDDMAEDAWPVGLLVQFKVNQSITAW